MSPVVLIGVVVVIIIVVALVASRRASVSGAQGHGPAPVTWTVTDVVTETPTSISFGVDGAMSFEPGQFVLLRPNSTLPWRAYSFSQAPGKPLRLTVKRVDGGKVSTHLTTQLRSGDRLEVKGPFGHFLLPATVTRGLFIAGGSGVTPFLSWLHALDERGWPFPITFIVGNRSTSEQILKRELDAMVSHSAGKLTVIQVTDDVQGPLTKECIASLIASLETPSFMGMCGPQVMMDNAREVVAARFPGITILEEKFSAAPEHIGDGPSTSLELFQDGEVKPFEVRPGEHVLAAARRAGYDLPSGCEMGACGACRVKLIDGDIQIPEDACLSDSEKQQGYRLICVGSARGKARFESAP
jgi:ferredoxin-NADP reductase